MLHVDVKPELLRWARARAGLDVAALAHRFPRLADWERGAQRPTLKQLEDFAKATHTAVGYLFLPTPPIERVPIPDYRTVGNVHIGRPSPDLLDTIYLCQQRQEWYHDYARSMGEKPLTFVGAASIRDDVSATAANMREALGFDLEARRQMGTWEEALRCFIEQADELGVLVMVNGVVGNNNHRKLDPEEFRGFALADNLAPLIFINGSDSKAAKMFTLAHELAHIWLGQSALSDAGLLSQPSVEMERWCNSVAAELLVPRAILEAEYRQDTDVRDEANRLARRFKVSQLVILRRIYDIGGITQEEYWRTYEQTLEYLRGREPEADGGGNFYYTQAIRVSKRFARALIASTLEGHTLHRDAFRLLGFSKLETFRQLGASLGVI
jgi:Zn-dependent peptidase ImmA (M78 family)